MFVLILKICLFFFFFFILGLLWIYWKKGKNFNVNREKGSAFECGFDPSQTSRLPFSLRFFLLLIFFLIFDIEIVLLLNLPIIFFVLKYKVSLQFLIFFWILFLGYVEEWRRGALKWKN